MKKRFIQIIALLSFFTFFSAAMCTKVITYAKDYQTDTVEHSYSSNISITMEQTKKVLESLGYAVQNVDESSHKITTGWRPTKSDSHYLELFRRRDYAGNSGAYYQIVVDIFEEGNSIKVAVHTMVKSLSGNLKSSHVVENKILNRLDDYMRSSQIEMNNVEVKDR